MRKKAEIEKNASTEEKIIGAARRVFLQKGYAATRTRDIAEASGLNLALINYYFRSKEKLFDIIMVENMQAFMNSVMGIVNDRQTTLREKMKLIIAYYIDMLIENPDMPVFVLNEIQRDPEKLFAKLHVNKDQPEPYIATQWKELVASGKAAKFNPVHMMMNVVGLTIFPFAGRKLIEYRAGIDHATFIALMEERKKLIPVWVEAIMKCEVPA